MRRHLSTLESRILQYINLLNYVPTSLFIVTCTSHYVGLINSRYDLFHTPADFPQVFDKIRHNIEEKQIQEDESTRIDIFKRHERNVWRERREEEKDMKDLVAGRRGGET